ncbi:MAG: hypothetical protein DI551_06520, partial [Micavibrio aeruginosavorus]
MGIKENDMTYSLSWCLYNCPAFLKNFCHTLGWNGAIDDIQIDLQKHNQEDKGYTDIELLVPGKWGAIVEAKRGYVLPSRDRQLAKYSNRLSRKAPEMNIVVLSNFNEGYVSKLKGYTDAIGNCGVKVISWASINKIALDALKECNNAQKRLLNDFSSYLKGLVFMSNATSNMVYVVSLNSGTEEGWDISWIDIVQKRS